MCDFSYRSRLHGADNLRRGTGGYLFGELGCRLRFFENGPAGTLQNLQNLLGLVPHVAYLAGLYQDLKRDTAMGVWEFFHK